MEDSMCWVFSPFKEYTQKMDYKNVNSASGLEDQMCWLKKIWKLRCPTKAQFFTWFLGKKYPLGTTSASDIRKGPTRALSIKMWKNTLTIFPYC